VALPLQIVEPHLPGLVAVAADRYETGVGPLVEEGQQKPSQREMAEMIGPELKLKAVGGPLKGRGHDAGVVDQQVDVVVAGSDAVSERSNRTEVGKVELGSLYGR